MEEVMVTTRVKNSTIFLRFSYYENGIANNVEVSSTFKCSGKGISTCRCEGHKSAIKLANAVSTAIDGNTFVFEKFFPHSALVKALNMAIRILLQIILYQHLEVCH